MSPVIKSSSIKAKSPKTQLEKILGGDSIVYSIQKVKDYRSDITRYIKLGKDNHRFLRIDGRVIRLSETAKVVIRDEFSCVDCGREAEFFGVYRAKNNHKDSYGVIFFHLENSRVVIHTKDHIIPKSRGGPNHMDNYQNLCTLCNSKKGKEMTATEAKKVFTVDKGLGVEDIEDSCSSSYIEAMGHYDNRYIYLDDRSVVEIYKGKCMVSDKVVLMDRMTYDKMKAVDDSHYRMNQSLSSFDLNDMPWFFKISGIKKVVEFYLEKFKKHIMMSSKKSREEMDKIIKELSKR